MNSEIIQNIFLIQCVKREERQYSTNTDMLFVTNIAGDVLNTD